MRTRTRAAARTRHLGIVLALLSSALFFSAPAADADQLRGAVLNDVFQLQTVGTATYLADSQAPSPYDYNTLVIFSGQIADSPESVADVTAELAALKAMGAQIIRFTIPWPSLETQVAAAGSPPQFNPLVVKRLDAIFAAIQASGLKAVVNFSNTPCGRSSSSDKNCNQLGVWSSYPPAQESDLTNAVEQLISNWGTDIYAIEVWNEPNNQGFFLGDKSQCDPSDPTALYGASADATRAAAYVPMVQAVRNAITASHSNILLVAGGMSLSDTTFLQDLYTDGIKGLADAISVHPYQLQAQFASCGGHTTYISQDPSQPFSDSLYSFKSGVEAVHSVMQQNGDTSPIWITEFGFNGCQQAPNSTVAQESGQTSANADWTGTCVGLVNQGAWLAESYQIASQWPYVGAIMMYQTRDGVTGESPFGFDNWGLFRHDLSPKPAAIDVKNEWSCLAQGTC